MALTNPTTTNSPGYGFGLSQEQMIELVRTHHPEMMEREIRIYLNQALRDFCKKTKVLRGVFQKTIIEGVRWYQLDDEIVDVGLVYFDGNKIERMIQAPDTEDLDVT